MEVYKEALGKGEAGKGFAVDGVVLLHKKGKQLLQNWRPITLLSVDYKLLAKVLAQHMGQVLDQVVGEDQTCAIRGRRLTDSQWILRDALCYVGDRKWKVMVGSIYLEKAYDSVLHDFLFRVLEKMGFLEHFEWVRVLYGNATSWVLVHGLLGDEFKVDKGVQQGCLLSLALCLWNQTGGPMHLEEQWG